MTKILRNMREALATFRKPTVGRISFPGKVTGVILLCGVGLNLLWHCKSPKSGESAVEHYIENNVLWALGQVNLSDAPKLPEIYLKKNKLVAESPIDRSLGVQALTHYQLIGQIDGDEKGMAIVDYHPSEDKLLSYMYQLQIAPNAQDSWVLYAKLAKVPGKSKRNILVLGQVNGVLSGDMLKVQLGSQWQRSLIVEGPMLGAWALHVPEVLKVESKPWVGLCPRDGDMRTPGAQGSGPGTVGPVGQNQSQAQTAPGQSVGQASQSPLQGPSQAGGCRLLRAENDLCTGNPLESGCMPSFDADVIKLARDFKNQLAPVDEIQNLSVIPGQQYGYQLRKGAPHGQVFLRFSSVKITDDAQNDRICRQGMTAVGRTLGGKVNPACQVRLLPSPKPSLLGGDKALRCGFQVQFLGPESYLEKICQISVQLRVPVSDFSQSGGQQVESSPQWSGLQVIFQ